MLLKNKHSYEQRNFQLSGSAYYYTKFNQYFKFIESNILQYIEISKLKQIPLFKNMYSKQYHKTDVKICKKKK